MIKLKPMLELSDREKELKKDYLFKLSQSNRKNRIPPFKEVWSHIIRSDGFKDIINTFKSNNERNNHRDSLRNFYRSVKEEQKERYDNIVYDYQQLNGKLCWRVIRLPFSVQPEKLPQLGIYWSIEKNKAEAHWGRFGPKYPIEVTYEGIINLKNVNWRQTIFARMDMSSGDEESEITFIPNGKIFIESVYIVPFDKTIYIRRFRRV